MIIPFGFLNKKETSSEPIDYTNYLEVDADVESDFIFTNYLGTYNVGLAIRSTNGYFCLETTGATPTTTTGATANPIGRSAYVYYEASGINNAAALSSLKRNISFDNSNQDLKISIIHNLRFTATFYYMLEYATIDAHNETTDWTTFETVFGTNVDLWESKIFDLSTAPASSTLWIRIRFYSDLATGDVCFSTWREYNI